MLSAILPLCLNLNVLWTQWLLTGPSDREYILNLEGCHISSTYWGLNKMVAMLQTTVQIVNQPKYVTNIGPCSFASGGCQDVG